MVVVNVFIATHESLHTIVVRCSSIDELVMINASTDAPIVTYTVLVLLYMSGLCKHIITLSKKTFFSLLHILDEKEGEEDVHTLCCMLN